MPALYEAPIAEFLLHEDDLIIGRLSNLTRQGFTELTALQLEAWRQQIPILKGAFQADCARNWHLLLEYPIPRRGKRIDAVILAGPLILVVEFKCGSKQFNLDAIVQVEDYCLDLRDFHKESLTRTLVPVLVATEAEDMSTPSVGVMDCVAPVWRSNRHGLGQTLQQAVAEYQSSETTDIDPHSWNDSQYLPTPTIIEAARVLYEGQSVREISRCHAGVDNLTRTSEAVMVAIQQARESGEKIISFVTGVPGAGKTLAGLNIIHNRELHEGGLGVFLSGNGPLVRVLSEALARDHSKRTQASLSESRRKVETFVQNVHRFIDAHFASFSPPPDRVIVFDEAQRAWDAEQSKRKFKRESSEPAIMLDIMDRHTGWAVVVALVGSGQEINTGEAGLQEWGRTLAERFHHWRIVGSPHIVGLGSSDEDRLFDAQSENQNFIANENLHLRVSLRSYKAQAVSEFVSHLLSLKTQEARATLALCPDYPIALTRDLGTAREWLKRRQRGSRRIGLVASSGGRRLRAFGLDVRLDLDVENWFLNPSNDTRSSYYLETLATEFGIQGLELDWVGVCWDIDFVPSDGEWKVEAFKGTKWQHVRDPLRRRYILNKYRVLLTRAREGMVIWVPRGDPADWTRPCSEYDSIARYLLSCGLELI